MAHRPFQTKRFSRSNQKRNEDDDGTGSATADKTARRVYSICIAQYVLSRQVLRWGYLNIMRFLTQVGFYVVAELSFETRGNSSQMNCTCVMLYYKKRLRRRCALHSFLESHLSIPVGHVAVGHTLLPLQQHASASLPGTVENHSTASNMLSFVKCSS